MEKNQSVQERVDALNEEYRPYIENIRRNWLRQNQPKANRSNRVYEVMYDHERAEVDKIVSSWKDYIAPIAEAWWKEKGFGVVWPDDDSKPMQLYELNPTN